MVEYSKARELKLLTLETQLNAIPFYEKMGFGVDSETYLEAGILHQRMSLTLKACALPCPVIWCKVVISLIF